MKDYANNSINLLRIGIILLVISLLALLTPYAMLNCPNHQENAEHHSSEISVVGEGAKGFNNVNSEITYFRPISEPSL
ncbi:MAG: hypothetical protein J7J75_04875 [Euryarchaeota archaeon]|nr:hypothetical protein [Euryarchaeota archaeon]